MKQAQITNAYNALRRVAEMTLPVKEAYCIYRLIKTLEEPYRFEVEKEKELFTRCGGFADTSGQARFPSKEKEQQFISGLQELSEFEPEVEIEPVVLFLDKLDGQGISPLDIASLEGFVRFE